METVWWVKESGVVWVRSGVGVEGIRSGAGKRSGGVWVGVQKWCDVESRSSFESLVTLYTSPKLVVMWHYCSLVYPTHIRSMLKHASSTLQAPPVHSPGTFL